MKSWLLALGTVLLIALHQDIWFWRTPDPVVFGILPIGLFYHAAYTLAAVAWMALLVKVAWPAHLERETQEPDS